MNHLRLAAHIARYAWALPCTAVGLCMAAPAFLFGARAHIIDGVLEIALSPRGQSVFDKLPFSAITFGHLVIATNRAALNRLRVHEHRHVRQYEQWGIFFFLAYPASSLWQLLRGRRPYVDNCFEVQARGESPSDARDR